MRRGRTAAAVVAGLGLLCALGLPVRAADLTTVELAEVEVPRERVLDGVVEAVNEATVSAQTSGRVAEVLFDVNDFVEAGAIIVKFTDREQRAAVTAARAARDEARARVTETEADLARAEDLLTRDAISRSSRDQLRANSDAARARLDAAEAGLAAARQELEYTRIRAPYAGIVSARHVEVGEAVRPGQPIMSGLSLQRLRVNVDVPQSIVDPVREHDSAWVRFDGERVQAQSITFFPFADPASKTFRVRVDLPEVDSVLYPGMFVKVAFVIGRKAALLVPEAAVVRRSELEAVYVLSNGDIGLRQVRLGGRYDGGREVLAGLEAGERVALDPVAADLERRRLAAAGGRDG